MFQRIIDITLMSVKLGFVVVYLDDIVIVYKTKEQHTAHV